MNTGQGVLASLRAVVKKNALFGRCRGTKDLLNWKAQHAGQYNESSTRGSNRGNATFLLDCSWCRDRSLFSGIVILINAKALHTTPLSLLSYVLSERPRAISFVLIATSILAVLPFVLKPKNHFVFIFLLAPQQVLLLAHFTSAFLAIMFGQYPDGYTPDGGSAFIFVDQVWLLMVVMLHTFEYIEAL
jgi:hypothetical protein